MKKIIAVYIIMGIICGIVVTGWMNANFRGIFPPDNQKTASAHLGVAAIEGMIASLGWPIITPFAWILTDFASSGWTLSRDWNKDKDKYVFQAPPKKKFLYRKDTL